MVSLKLVDVLNRLVTPFSVDSLTRTPAHNAVVGGAPKSAHLDGKAADLLYDSRRELIAGACEARVLGVNGIELDLLSLHLHLDVKPRIWRVVTTDGGKTESPLAPWLAAYKPGEATA